MNKEELAAKLNGLEYPLHKHLTEGLLQEAKDSGLVIVYGESDDLAKFDGAYKNEVCCYEGGTLYVDAKGVLDRDQVDDDDDAIADYVSRKRGACEIEAVWCDNDGPAWSYKTNIPHATFDVMEDGEVYCKGIVFAVIDLGGAL